MHTDGRPASTAMTGTVVVIGLPILKADMSRQILIRSAPMSAQPRLLGPR
jgi:hypothetical protein